MIKAEQIPALVNRFESGESACAIARSLGLSPHPVRQILIEAGVDTSKRHINSDRYVTAVKAPGGYMQVLVDPESVFADMANVSGYAYEHRMVVARALGRSLRPDESVHHLNGDRTDNRLENLELRQRFHGHGGTFRCMDCGSTNIEPTTQEVV